MQTAMWWAQLLFASWLLVGALVFFTIGVETYRDAEFSWWGAAAPPTLALAIVICPDLPIWYWLVSGVLVTVCLGRVAEWGSGPYEYGIASVWSIALGAAWLPWLATLAAFAAWQLGKDLLDTRLETSLIPGPDDS